jgi:ADP-heptose:LPS heptosyltransferase
MHVLQKEIRADDLDALRNHPQVSLHHEQLGDFADTAALLELMDLVISVDTSVAHLAGAMARPVWILLPFLADHRWLVDRTDSPWYPTAQLIRQRSSGDWTDVMATVAQRLADLAARHAPNHRSAERGGQIGSVTPLPEVHVVGIEPGG